MRDGKLIEDVGVLNLQHSKGPNWVSSVGETYFYFKESSMEHFPKKKDL